MAENNQPSKNLDLETTFIYLLPNGLSKSYIENLKRLALINKFKLEENFDINTTKILVSNINDSEKICKLIKLNSKIDTPNVIHFVNLQWLIDSNKCYSLCNCEDKKYYIGSIKNLALIPKISSNPKPNIIDIPDYECQRATPIKHFNEEFTDALEVLEEHAEFKGTDQDLVKALAFRRGICILKFLKFKVNDTRQIKNLKHMGDHTISVIEVLLKIKIYVEYVIGQDILKYGYSKEVDYIKSQDYYKSMKIFYSIYGCGAITANRLFENGFRNIESLRDENLESLSKKIQTNLSKLKYGLTYFDDLNIKKITQNECKFIFEYIKQIILEYVDKDCLVELTGGFRRGKSTGHDVDLLISHPEKDKEKEILLKLIEILEKKEVVVFGNHQKRSNHDWTKSASKNILDHFEKYISILKIPSHFYNSAIAEKDEYEQARKKIKKIEENECLNIKKHSVQLDEFLENLDASKFKRNWYARRIDLVVSPIDEFPFALLGWIGSKQFNRSIRLFSEKEFGYKLSSHGMFDHRNHVFIKATSEKDIFNLLGLKFLEHNERNC